MNGRRVDSEVELSNPQTYAKWDGASSEELLRDWMILTSLILVQGEVRKVVPQLQEGVARCPVVADQEARDIVRETVGLHSLVGLP